MASIKWEIKKGPNGEVQKQPTITWPTGEKEMLPLLPDFPLNFSYTIIDLLRSLPNNKNLDPILTTFATFVLYMWYKIDGRSLVHEEVASTMRMVFYGNEKKLTAQTRLLARFDAPGDHMTTEFQSVDNNVKELWITQASIWFEKVREISSSVEARIKGLDGFKGRFPNLNEFRKFKSSAPKVLSRRLESYQMCSVYGVIHMTRDHYGPWTEDQLRRFFAHYLKCPLDRVPKSLTENLTDANDELTQEVAIVAQNERYRPWIHKSAENIVNAWCIKYHTPQYLTASVHPRYLPATTASLGGLSLTATASSSHEPTALDSGLPQHEMEHGMQPMNPQSTSGPSQSTGQGLSPARILGSGLPDSQPTESQDEGRERVRGPSVGLPERQIEEYGGWADWGGNAFESTESQDEDKERARESSVGLSEEQDENFDDLIDWGGNESEPTQPKGKGKEKARGRESSSSASKSPEGKGSGGKKPAAKKIRSAGGKQ